MVVLPFWSVGIALALLSQGARHVSAPALTVPDFGSFLFWHRCHISCINMIRSASLTFGILDKRPSFIFPFGHSTVFLPACAHSYKSLVFIETVGIDSFNVCSIECGPSRSDAHSQQAPDMTRLRRCNKCTQHFDLTRTVSFVVVVWSEYFRLPYISYLSQLLGMVLVHCQL